MSASPPPESSHAGRRPDPPVAGWQSWLHEMSQSPWFWMLLFTLTALGALGGIGPKYLQRQQRIERMGEGQRRAAEFRWHGDSLVAVNPEGGESEPPETFASRPSLVPLTSALLVVAAVAWVGLRLQQRSAAARRARGSP